MSDRSPYSPQWFETFLLSVDPAETDREVAFLASLLPLSRFRCVLDACCGVGRHAVRLAQCGYSVTAFDVDVAMIERAQMYAAHPNVTYRAHDLREIDALPNSQPGMFDAVICLWQSFGQFDDRTNRDVLAAMAGCLRPGGRLVLDVYHRAFFAARQGERVNERNGRRIIERKTLVGDRLTVELIYTDDGIESARDTFSWQIFLPEELTELGRSVGMRTLQACSRFDQAVPAGEHEPRMQIIAERIVKA